MGHQTPIAVVMVIGTHSRRWRVKRFQSRDGFIARGQLKVWVPAAEWQPFRQVAIEAQRIHACHSIYLPDDMSGPINEGDVDVARAIILAEAAIGLPEAWGAAGTPLRTPEERLAQIFLAAVSRQQYTIDGIDLSRLLPP